MLAALGGFALNMMNLYEDSQREKSARTSKDFLYFIMFIFWPCAGGFLGYLYSDSGNVINGLLAFHIGVSAPILLKAMVETAAPINAPRNDNAEP